MAGPGREAVTSLSQFDGTLFLLPANASQPSTANLLSHPCEHFFQRLDMSQGTMTLAMSLPSLGLPFSLLCPHQGSGRGKGSGFENPFFFKVS